MTLDQKKISRKHFPPPPDTASPGVTSPNTPAIDFTTPESMNPLITPPPESPAYSPGKHTPDDLLDAVYSPS